jgi:hypothetical protein
MPWTAKKLLWNPEPLGSFFGEVCLQAWRQNPGDFGREVLEILEARLGVAELEEALSAPLIAPRTGRDESEVPGLSPLSPIS